MNPVAGVLPIAIDRYWAACKGIDNEERQLFFWILIWAVVVGAARNDDWQPISGPIGEGQAICSSFAGRVGGERLERIRFQGGSAGPVWGFGVAINFVGANLDEARDTLLASSFKQDKGSLDIRANERAGIKNRAINMGFGSEMDHPITGAHSLSNNCRVADVAVNKSVALVGAHLAEIIQVARVGELIKD